ncbi:M56 family metallopeptidase [Undibacterium sp. TJN19]|uniref:M56 family metallopeptidase n=1 Tax=Undibacterium sp. TJN19 TaxID=3413055 RepID=UPI003BF33D88
MINNLLQTGILASLVISGLIALILLARLPLRKLAGAGIAYQLWATLPLALLAITVPRHDYLEMATSLNVPVNKLLATATTLDAQAISAWPAIFILVWLVGSLAMLVLFGVAHRRFLRKLGRLTEDEGVYLASGLDIGPALAGCFKPKIILPGDFFERYSAEEQTLIIRHEQVHLRRGDVYANCLSVLLQCLFWFNPLVHFAARCFRLDQELACDASVIARYPQARRTYAEAMLKTQFSFTPSALACHWPSHHPLKERIMQLQQSTPSLLKRATAYAFICGLGCASAYSAWAAMPASTVVNETKQAKAVAKPGVISYLVNTDISIGGEKISPRVMVEQGKLATISVTSKEQQAKWDISFSLVPAPTDKYKNSVTISMIVKKNGALVAEPKLITGLNQTATLQKETPDKQEDFDIKMTANVVKNPG